MRQQAKEWVGFLIGILVAVPGLPYLAGLVGLWITFFRPPYNLSQAKAWEAAFDVPRDLIYLYGIQLVWPVVPVSLFFTGFILLLWTSKSDSVQRKVRRNAVALMVIGWITWWVKWTYTAITAVAVLVLIAVFVWGLGYALWSASGSPRQEEGEEQEGEDAGTHLPTGILISLGALYVALIAVAVLRAPTTPMHLKYLVNEKEPKVVGQVTGYSEDTWHYFACKGNVEKVVMSTYVTQPIEDTIGKYTSSPKRDFYKIIQPKTKKQYDKTVGIVSPQDPESFLPSFFNTHAPEPYVDLCVIRKHELSILLNKGPIPPASPYQSGHFP